MQLINFGDGIWSMDNFNNIGGFGLIGLSIITLSSYYGLHSSAIAIKIAPLFLLMPLFNIML